MILLKNLFILIFALFILIEKRSAENLVKLIVDFTCGESLHLLRTDC